MEGHIEIIIKTNKEHILILSAFNQFSETGGDFTKGSPSRCICKHRRINGWGRQSL